MLATAITIPQVWDCNPRSRTQTFHFSSWSHTLLASLWVLRILIDSLLSSASLASSDVCFFQKSWICVLLLSSIGEKSRIKIKSTQELLFRTSEEIRTMDNQGRTEWSRDVKKMSPMLPSSLPTSRKKKMASTSLSILYSRPTRAAPTIFHPLYSISKTYKSRADCISSWADSSWLYYKSYL